MPDQAAQDVATTLRALVERRGLTMASLSKATGIPYRSLQNYFANKNEMPVTVYLKICSTLDIEATYPTRNHFNLDRYALQNALLQVLGEEIPTSEFTTDGGMILVPNIGQPRSEYDLFRDAGTLAMFIQSRYDAEREKRLDEKLDAADF